MEKLQILKVELEQKGDSLLAIVETPYGVFKYGMKSKRLYLDYTNDLPMWVNEVSKSMTQRYQKEVIPQELYEKYLEEQK